MIENWLDGVVFESSVAGAYSAACSRVLIAE